MSLHMPDWTCKIIAYNFYLIEIAVLLETNQELVKLERSLLGSLGLQLMSLEGVKILQYKQEHYSPFFINEFIPVNKTQIPTSETAKACPYLDLEDL